MSDNASGETEAFSDPSVEIADTEVGFGGRSAFSTTDSANSPRACAFIAGVEPVFFR